MRNINNSKNIGAKNEVTNKESTSFSRKLLDITDDIGEKVYLYLFPECTDKEYIHIINQDDILIKLKAKKMSIMDALVLIYEYTENKKEFNYETEGVEKTIQSNLNKTLSQLKINYNSINFDMVKEYIENNPKK